MDKASTLALSAMPSVMTVLHTALWDSAGEHELQGGIS